MSVLPIGAPASAVIAAARRQRASFAEMRSFLRALRLWTVEEGGVFESLWTLPGKPAADVFFENRAQLAAWRMPRTAPRMIRR